MEYYNEYKYILLAENMITPWKKPLVKTELTTGQYLTSKTHSLTITLLGNTVTTMLSLAKCSLRMRNERTLLKIWTTNIDENSVPCITGEK